MQGPGGHQEAANHKAASDLVSPQDVVEVLNAAGAGNFVVVCEHASNYVPAPLGDLGLDEAALQSHIAWDPGALAVARAMAGELDAPLVAQRVSRLVYDCNRPPEAPSAVPEESEIYRIPGNADLSDEARAARVDQVYLPFRNTLAACIEERLAAGGKPVVITVHSFNPTYRGAQRAVELGVLHDEDARLADAFLAVGQEAGEMVVRRNDPYGPADGVTHTLVEHAMTHGLLNVMLEIRNDLIDDAASQQAMAARLVRYTKEALAKIEAGPDSPG